MPRACWLSRNGRPCIQVNLIKHNLTYTVVRTLLADTGAGSHYSRFELILNEGDCNQLGMFQPAMSVSLGGAYSGTFSIYLVRVQIPALSFNRQLPVVPVPAERLPAGFDGLAAFSFLNRFTYGNFGHNDQFSLETP
jgi:hypothetical protein